MIKEHVDIEGIKKAAIEILEQLENIKQFGHVGCYAVTKEQVEKDSKEALEKTLEVVNILQIVNGFIVDSYEY